MARISSEKAAKKLGSIYNMIIIAAARVVPGSGNAYKFNNRPELIKAFNQKLHVNIASEANLAFDFFIKIFSAMWIDMNKGK